MLKQPIFESYHPFFKLLLFAFILLSFLLFSYLLGMLIAIPFYGTSFITGAKNIGDLSDPSNVSLLKFLQMCSQTGMVTAVLLFSFFVNRNISSYLNINKFPRFFSILLIISILLVSVPLINKLSELNSQIKFGVYFKNIESSLKSYEEKNNVLLEVFLKADSFKMLLFNIFMIGLFTAIIEEFVFRGVILKIFHEWTKNKHLAVIISAFIFASLHLQFYKIIPIFLLGTLLGYIYIWTKCLWAPIFLHFINNTISVVYSYYHNKGMIGDEIEKIGVNQQDNLLVLISFISVASLIIVLYFYENKMQILKDTEV